MESHDSREEPGWPLSRENLAHPSLMHRIGIGMQECDGDAADAQPVQLRQEGQQGALVQGQQDLAGSVDPLWNGKATMPRRAACASSCRPMPSNVAELCNTLSRDAAGMTVTAGRGIAVSRVAVGHGQDRAR